MRDLLWLVALPTLVFGCGDEPITPCGLYECVMEFEALATPAELASTPREDSTAELMALDLSPGLVATSDAYDRVVRDLRGMKNSQTPLGALYRGRHDGKLLALIMDSPAASAHEAGLYTAWDNLSALYETESIEAEWWQPGDVIVELKGIYDLRLLAQEYVKLPGVVAAGPARSDEHRGNSPYSNICVWAEEDSWRYLAQYNCNDCMAGCGLCEYKYFESKTAEPAYEIELPLSGVRERADVCFVWGY